jgi:hypothetical protein
VSDFDDSWWQASQGTLPAQREAQQQSYRKAWLSMLEQQAAAKQQAWQAFRGMVPGQGQAPAAWAIGAPGQNVAMPNPLLSRANVPSLAQADPGNALAGYFMGQGDADPLMMHQLLGGQPGLSNV